MKISDLKQRQKVKDKRTGETYQVSKRWNAVYLLDPQTKQPRMNLRSLATLLGQKYETLELDWLGVV